MTELPFPNVKDKPRADIHSVSKDFSVDELDNEIWKTAHAVDVTRYWSGEDAPEGRIFEARLLWSETALYVRFEAMQSEPLFVSESPVLDEKALGLWERDVCELFVAPDKSETEKYFEFEIAPTGEWLDLGIHQASEERVTDWEYDSKMTTASRIESDRVLMALKIGWSAFGGKPSVGDIWAGNLYRAVGEGETRAYLAWSPTFTEKPNFHVPERFGELVFGEL